MSSRSADHAQQQVSRAFAPRHGGGRQRLGVAQLAAQAFAGQLEHDLLE